MGRTNEVRDRINYHIMQASRLEIEAKLHRAIVSVLQIMEQPKEDSRVKKVCVHKRNIRRKLGKGV